MKKIHISTSLFATAFLVFCSVSFSQHSQDQHEELVDDFFTPYPFVVSEQLTFTGSIGASGTLSENDEFDLWDYYVFQSPGPGQIDIELKGFKKPVSLGLEQDSPEGGRNRMPVAESMGRFVRSHQISTEISPGTTYFIAVGAGVLDNGNTPYELIVTYAAEKTEPPSLSSSGDYELSLTGGTCKVPGSVFPDTKLPIYMLSSEKGRLSAGLKRGVHTDNHTHEMLQFDSSHGTLLHEFSDVYLDEESELSLHRDIVIAGSFEGGRFHGEVTEHDILMNSSGDIVREVAGCSRQVTAIGH